MSGRAEVMRNSLFSALACAAIVCQQGPAQVAARSQASGSARTAEEQQWQGLRKAMLDFYLHGTKFEGIEFEEYRLLHPLLTNVIQGEQAMIMGNMTSAKRKWVAARYQLELPKETTLNLIDPKELASPARFREARSAYLNGGSITRLGFPDGLGISAQPAGMIIPGATIGGSYFIERIGIVRQRPQQLRGWNDAYEGKPLEVIYKLDPGTGEKGTYAGYIVEVLSKGVRYKGKLVGHYVLRKLVISDAALQLPHYLVSEVCGAVEFQGGMLDYEGHVVGDDGAPVKTGLFRRFACSPTVQGLNAPAVFPR